MKYSKINLISLQEMLDKGLTQAEIARQFNVSPARICQLTKELKLATRDVVQLKAEEIVDTKINAAMQLKKINQYANNVLDNLMVAINGNDEKTEKLRLTDKELREISARYMQEIRSQLKLQMDIYKSLYGIKLIETFQHAVLEAINEVEPEVKVRIIEKLRQARARRPNFQM